MAKRIVAALIVIAVLAGLYWQYMRYSAAKRLRDGDVVVADSDGALVQPTPSRSDAPGTINTDAAPAAAQRPASPAQSAATQSAATQSASLTQFQARASQPAAAVPATDSQNPDAPNGMAFAGSGRFQVYRQGNLTWRINTDDGSTCILFATHEEWRKPDVYAHGCPNG